MVLSFGITYLHLKKTLITLIRFDLRLMVTYSYNRHCTLHIYFPFDFFVLSLVTRLSIRLVSFPVSVLNFFTSLYMAFDKSCMTLIIVN